MRFFKNLFKTFGSKIISSIMIVCLIITAFSFIVPVLAGDLGQELTLVGGVSNDNYMEFYNGEILMGSVLAKIGEDILTPINDKLVLPEFSEDYEVDLYVTAELGYEVREFNLDGTTDYMPGDGILHINISSDNDLELTLNFESLNEGSGPGGGPMINVPILAYFDGEVIPVESTPEGMIFIPDTWISGDVYFKAKVCRIGEDIVPNDGITECDPGTEELSDLNIQGINNFHQINGSVSSSEDHTYLIVDAKFQDFGKTGIHLTNELFNTMIDLISNTLINVEAMAPMRMHYSYGLSTIDQTIVTNSQAGDVSIFFGNGETTLMATGPKVDSITSLAGANHKLNEDGTVTVFLPPLSAEVKTTVTITIKLTDNSVVTRKINIIRTAIELAYEGESRTIRAGYVMHKAYLYNNLPHNDQIFDAYLQVIIYKDDVVVGYRQIQIDDAEFVNNLGPNESGSIDSGSPDATIVYDGKIKGANKVSVFLTNGPIDYKSKTLPSIEFGLGAGVEYKWGIN